MKPISPNEVQEWLTQHERSAAWLARTLGVSKATVSRWLNGHRPIPPPETRLLRLLIHGEDPFRKSKGNPISVEKPMLFSPEEWALIEKIRRKKGFSCAEEVIAAVVRSDPKAEKDPSKP